MSALPEPVEAIRCRAKRLLASASLRADITLEPLGAGGNNRVFLARASEKNYVVKQYFASSQDPRDRLGAEWQFLAYAERIGLDCVPRPVCFDSAARIGIMQFVEGRPIRVEDVGHSLVMQAADFFLHLNASRVCDFANTLPIASEACFSIEAQCELVGRRVASLDGIKGDDAEGRAARTLVGEITRRFGVLREHLLYVANDKHGPVADPLAAEQRCISPSDFGFHNALLDADGKVIFLDFEYAGWDDPAKMAADFFCHPGVPVDLSYLETFLDRSFEGMSDGRRFVRRTRLMLPLFRLKWCCIMLNEFLPTGERRRKFANPLANSAAWRGAQVRKVSSYLEHVLVGGWT